MTDGLVNLAPLSGFVATLYAKYGGYLVAFVALYLGLFLVGLLVEAVRFSRTGDRPDV